VDVTTGIDDASLIDMTSRSGEDSTPVILAIALIAAAALLGVGCGCHTVQGIKQARKVTGQLTYQLPGAAPATAALASSASFMVQSDLYGAYPGDVAFTFSPDDPSVQATNPASYYVRLVVGVAPGGPSEVDLTDANSTLTVSLPATPSPMAYTGVTGHLSLQGIDATCGEACPLRAHGTLTISATGPNSEIFALASGQFAANDSTYDTGMCQD
jgi:hypothetical protein